MEICYVDIQNFRKLKCCRIELGKRETVFVGANNSGKTSAMDALILFLKKNRQKDISVTDFTLSNWKHINDIGANWVKSSEDDNEKIDINLSVFRPYMPSVDIWLDVVEGEIHYVSHLIPTLSWEGGLLGVRLCLEPKNGEELYADFVKAYRAAQMASAKKTNLSLWPKDLKDFLERRLTKYFSINAYILDPSKANKQVNNSIEPQDLPDNSEALDFDPFKELFKIDVIPAQRGFADAKTSSDNTGDNLTSQLRDYYDKHLDPSELPEEKDIDALEAIEEAQKKFDDKLKVSFQGAITELENLGYPGFSDPKISLCCKVNPVENLKHDSAVQFNIGKNESSSLSLPEKYNGLGYQNLISMVFKLIRFRDEWMRKGKASYNSDEKDFIEPLHLVLIEEPEAHLHAQVQQVFIKKAYDVLRNHKELKKQDEIKKRMEEKKKELKKQIEEKGEESKKIIEELKKELKNANFLSTQMIVSTHSSHIAHEINFTYLRYFQKKPATTIKSVPCTEVINLSTTFGEENKTSKFATRYLKTTHCDLFFADAVILVEGPAERMLVPYFIKKHHKQLDSRYISLLEIGGSHAHRLRSLIEDLGLPTLVITDIDSIKSDTQGKVLPKRGEGYRTGNNTLKDWLPQKSLLDDLLDLDEKKKISDSKFIRVVYQTPIKISYEKDECEVIPYTFEDALVFSNQNVFKELSSSIGLIKKMYDALKKDSAIEACTEIFEALKDGKKAEMALELIYLDKIIVTPQYIADGLVWLENMLRCKDYDYIVHENIEEDK